MRDRILNAAGDKKKMAAQNGLMTLLGNSGRTYTVDVYLPDAVSTLGTFNATGAASATSPNQYRIPENCILVDFALATAPTATGGVIQKNSSAENAAVLRYANQLTSLPNRQKLRVPLRAGDFIGITQF